MPHKPYYTTVGLLLSAADHSPRPRRRIDKRFLSVTLDYACLIGAPWWEGTYRTRHSFGQKNATPVDLMDSKLMRYARALAPAFLRLGGSEADRIWYAVGNGLSDTEPPGGRRSESLFRSVLTQERWNEVGDFARKSGLELFVTLNAGAGPRDLSGRWDPANAQELLMYVAQQEHPVGVWEFGNEVSGFPFVHGPLSHISAGRYAADFSVFHDMVRRYAPKALTAGPASAYWPVVGEMLPFIPQFVRHLQRVPDIITWHYYPQQSSRGLLSIRRADPFKVLRPRILDGAAYWARRVIRHSRRAGSAARGGSGTERRPPEATGPRNGSARSTPEVWLGETGHALYGGEPNVSDRFIAGLWWLDQLGLMARNGVRVVVRQSLVGGDYGLLDTATREPRPDYWNSILWKRLMGEYVYATTYAGSPLLRVYAHNTPNRKGGVSFLLINLHHAAEIPVSVDSRTLGFTPRELETYTVTASDPFSESVSINGMPPKLPDDTALPPGPRALHSSREPLLVPPLSYLFLVAVPEYPCS